MPFYARPLCRKAEADADRFIDAPHGVVVELAHLFLKAVLIDGSDLLEQHNGILLQAGAVCMQGNVRRQVRLIPLAPRRSPSG